MQFTSQLRLEGDGGVIKAKNIANLLTPDECSRVANEVVDGYKNDKSSRSQWETDYAAAMQLALQITGIKTEPWENASNVKFPLITIAALHFHAKAYPMLIPGPDVAKCRVIGNPTPEKIQRASRVSTHMSWQLLEEDEDWEGEHDKAILVTGILGCAFKKTYFDPFRKYVTGRLVLPKDLVVNYWTKGDVNTAPRVTQVLEMSKNEVRERIVAGHYCDYDKPPGPAAPQTDPITEAKNTRQGILPPVEDEATPTEILEQLCWYDLDGDGYSEPYVATVENGTSSRLLRLKARFNSADVEKAKGKVQRIEPIKIYTKYELIPAPDGGFYPMGFGRLLGPINDAVNTMLNQIIDAATLSNYGGGFLGRGARFVGGTSTFKPQEWKQVNSTGDDLRKNLIPLPVREPSAVLLQLLMYLVGYGERIASANELQMGEDIGQNTPAATARTMNQNGSRIFAACYKRQWRGLRDELRVRYGLNAIYLEVDSEYENLTSGEGAMIQAADYLGPITDVRPAADPTMVDDEQRKAQANYLLSLAFKIPGFNRYLSTRRALEANGVQDIDKVFPPPPVDPKNPQAMPDLPSPPDPKMLEIQIKQGELQLKQQEQQVASMSAQIEMKRMIMEMQQEAAESQARVMELQAKATKELAEAKGVETGHMVGILQVEMQAEKLRSDKMLKMIDLMQGHLEGMAKVGSDHAIKLMEKTDAGSNGSVAGSTGLAAAPANGGFIAPPAPGLN